MNVYNLVVANLPVPSMLIFLRCTVEVLMSRIHKRGRDNGIWHQRRLSRAVESYYDDWTRISIYARC
jgi:deoxyadenosine/deoxycytidine kinase